MTCESPPGPAGRLRIPGTCTPAGAEGQRRLPRPWMDSPEGQGLTTGTSPPTPGPGVSLRTHPRQLAFLCPAQCGLSTETRRLGGQEGVRLPALVPLQASRSGRWAWERRPGQEGVQRAAQAARPPRSQRGWEPPPRVSPSQSPEDSGDHSGRAVASVLP